MLASRSGSSSTVGDRRLHRAPRLVLVLAVAEPAVVHQIEHIGERPLDAAPAAPQADGAHAGRVDQPAAARQAAPAPSRWWCAGRAGRPRAPPPVAARGCPTSALISVLLPTPLAPSRAIVALPAANAASASTPSPLIPLAVSTGTPGAADVQRGSTDARRVVDEVALGQHDDRARRHCPTPAPARVPAAAGSVARSARAPA